MENEFSFTFRVYGYGANNGYASLGQFNGSGTPANTAESDDKSDDEECEIEVKITHPSEIYLVGT